MTLTVKFRNHDPVALLIGRDGHSQIKPSGGFNWLVGEFKLEVGGTAARDWISFDENSPAHWCTVVEENGTWWLDKMREQAFQFDPLITLQPAGAAKGPWLCATRAHVLSRSGGVSRVDLPDASVSLVGSIPFAAGNKFHFPSKTGASSVELKEIRNPQGDRGILLEKRPEGFVIVARLGDFAELNRFEGTTLFIPDDNGCECLFSVPTGNKELDATRPAVSFRGEAAQFGMRIIVEKSVKARLNDRHPTNGDATEVRVNRADVIGDWLAAFDAKPKRDKDVVIELIPDGGPPELGTTSVRSGPSVGVDSSEIRFYLPVDHLVADDSVAPHFEFRSASDKSPDRREQYRGIRIRGIGWSKGGPGRLDASIARVGLFEQSGRTAFALQGGTKIKVAGILLDSVVTPKLDRAKGRRLLTIPAGPMAVEVAGGETLVGRSPITIDTAKRLFSIADPKLVGPPVGALAFEEKGAARFSDTSGPTEGFEYSRWRMGLPNGEPFTFELTDEGAFPKVKPSGGSTPSWQQQFETETTTPFPLLEHPGATVSIDGSLAKLRTLTFPGKDASSKKTTLTSSTKWDATGKEKLVYSTFVTLVSYKLIQIALKPGEKFLPDNSIIDTAEKLDDPTVNKWVKANGIDDHIRVYFATDGSQDEEIKRFILENVALTPETTMAYWPFAMGISVLLYRQKVQGQLGGSFAPEIARERGKAAPGIAFDWSHLSSLWDRAGQPGPTKEFGWDDAELTKLAVASPQLWPRKSGNDGSRLDPTDKHWRGIIVRHLPMNIYLPPAAEEEINKLPFLKKLIGTINEHLVLDYGWKDETGPTWNAELFFKVDEGIVSPDDWKEFLVIRVASFGTTGASGKIVSAKGKIEVKLPKFTDDAGKAIVLDGEFTFNLAGGPILERVEVSTSNTLYKSNSFPGFETFAISRLSTDFRSVEITFELNASDGLAAALPFLSSDAPLVAVVRFDLTGKPGASVSFLLPSEQETNLFGKWPLVVQSLRMTFSPHVEVRARCRLNLGLGSFTSVGAEIILKKTNTGFTLNVVPSEISGSIDFGDFSIEGALYWAEHDSENPKPPGEGSEIQGEKVAKDGPSRDIWGLIRVKSGNGLFDGLNKKGNTDALWLRIGSRGELSFWIIALSTTREISFGAGSIEDAMFIIAKNADKGQLIEKSLANLQVDAMKKLRVAQDENPRNWLASWEPSSKVGTLVAASGYIKFQEPIATSSKGDDDSSNKYMTSLAFTSNGVIRVEAAAKLLGTANVRFGIGVDLPRKFFSAGIILPTLNYPSDSSPEFTIQGGQIILGVGFGDDKEVYLSVGWPPKIENDPADPLGVDWSKSVMIRWDNFFPINTFWGGFLAAYKESTSSITLGYALRAGWTKQWKLGGDLIGASAELGVAIGGVVILRFSWNKARSQAVYLPLPHIPYDVRVKSLLLEWESTTLKKSAEVPEAFASIRRSQRRVQEILSDLARFDIVLEATVFIDVWGNASATVFGVRIASIEIAGRVRLHICLDVDDLKIIRADAFLGFTFKLKIGCFTVEASGSATFVFIDNGPCPVLNKYGHVAQAPRRMTRLLPSSN